MLVLGAFPIRAHPWLNHLFSRFFVFSGKNPSIPAYLSFVLYNLYFSFLVRFANQLFYFPNSLPLFTKPL